MSEVNAFDFAMGKELDAEKLYRSLAEKSQDVGLANIMNKLADVEAKHYAVLKQMKDAGGAATTIEMDPDNYRGAFKTLFKDLGEQIASFDFEVSQVDMYKLARQREEEAQGFYSTQAADADTDEARDLFEKLAAQEQLHYDILDSVIEFVSKPEPGNWLENAEWYHSEDY